MGDRRLPYQDGHVGKGGERGKTWAGGEGEIMDGLHGRDHRMFGITGDWSTAALDPGVWYSTVCEGGCRFIAACVREEEKASENRQRRGEEERRSRRGGQG